ncbi:MAG: M56 family metallopeptidase [Planctomycetota bacterium]
MTAWDEVLVVVAVKVTALLALALAVDAAGRWRATWSAAQRHALWTAVLGGALLLSLAVVLVSPLRPASEVEAAQPAIALPALLDSEALDPQSLLPPASSTPWSVALVLWSLVLWGVGLAVLLARLAAQAFALARLRRRSREFPPARVDLVRACAAAVGATGAVAVRTADGVTTPLTFGGRRPIVLLPQAATSWSAAQLRIVLLHELAHVARRDFATNLLGSLACAALWPHPMVWIARRRQVAARERAADDRVLATGVRDTDYAASLVTLARELRAPTAAIPTLACPGADGLGVRVRAILDTTVPRRAARVGRVATVGASAAVLLAAVDPRPDPAVLSAAAESAMVAQLRSTDGAARLQACLTLGGPAERRSFYEIVRLVRDPDRQVRVAAVWALARIGCVPAFVVINAALADPDPEVRRIAAVVLRRFAPQLRDLSFVATKRKFPPHTLRSVREALPAPSAPTSQQQLERRLQDPDPRVREAVRGTLGLR